MRGIFQVLEESRPLKTLERVPRFKLREGEAPAVNPSQKTAQQELRPPGFEDSEEIREAFSEHSGRIHRCQLAIEGKHDQLVTELRGLVEEKPDELSLRVELADALDGAGDVAAAEKELLEFGYRLQQQMGQDWAMPDWLAFRLSDLRAKADSAE